MVEYGKIMCSVRGSSDDGLEMRSEKRLGDYQGIVQVEVG